MELTTLLRQTVDVLAQLSSNMEEAAEHLNAVQNLFQQMLEVEKSKENSGCTCRPCPVHPDKPSVKIPHPAFLDLSA